MNSLIFYPCAGLALLTALVTVLATNPMHSAVALTACLFSLAPIFLGFAAHFVGTIQVLVYAGAIMVLFLFVIMLMNLRPEELPLEPVTPGRVAGLTLAVLVAGLLLAGISHPPAASAFLHEGFGTLRSIGLLLIGRFPLLILASSLLLVTATVAVVSLARREGIER